MVNNCFAKKSNLVKCLILLLTILIIVLIALFVNLVIRKDEHICNSEHCIKAAAEIIRYIDQSTNPCDDFHAFSCGHFIKNMKELPPPQPDEELELMIADFPKLNDTKPFVMQKSFYQSCVNLGGIEMDQEETILEMFYGLGDWPVLRGATWNGTFFDWTEIVKKSRRLGMKFDWFLNFSIYEDVNHTRTNVLKIDVPSSLKPLTSEDISLRTDLLTDIAEFMGAPKYLAHYETAKTIQFEDELGIAAERHRGREQEWDISALPKLAIHEIQTLWPSILWLDLINNVTGNRMTGSDYVIFNILDYIKDLNKLILGTPKRIVADYMMWKIVEESWQFLSRPIRDKFEKYNEAMFGIKPELNRQKFCINESKKQFPLVADSVYIRRHVTEQKRLLVREMLFIIQRQFTRLLEDASWMKRESRRRALSRIQDIKFMIGGPPEIFDQFGFADSLGVYGFAFKSTNVIDMLNERRDRFFDKYFSVLNRAIRNNTLRYYEEVINISNFSIINENTIVIPAAVLRDSFYNPDLPNYLNYGTLAKALAHEIFNYILNPKNSTIDYEKNSNYDNWWASNPFEQPIRCLIKESSYFHNSEFKRPNRMRTYLADFVASDVAYESYVEWSRRLPQEFTLPGLNFTPNQLFWIQTSKSSCSKIYTKYDRDNSRFKIIGPVRNSHYFGKDFSCLEGAKMNPKRKCRLL